jgi:hypothetical protein
MGEALKVVDLAWVRIGQDDVMDRAAVLEAQP